MMKAIMENWGVMRGLRLGIGFAVLAQSIIQKDIVVAVLAGFLLLTAIANIGCCGRSECTVDFKKSKKKKESVYEELDNK